VLEIHLRDLSASLAAAWEEAFAGVPGVSISQGDIFSTQPGPLPNDAPIDVTADAVVSPANSFGYMNGGIDSLYTHQFGFALQQRLQALLVAEYGGELPVGCAVIVETGSSEIPWCISAPTMRVPQSVPDTVNAYLAFRAALRAVLAHNAAGRRPIQRILCPGLATAIGRMPVGRCAAQMRAAWDNVLGEGPPQQQLSAHAAADLHQRLLLA
jgi:O-acetyl-ADP-ribose deacetylase (regulator of RNase III)